MIYFIIWWLIGALTYSGGCVLFDKKLTPKNLYEAMYIGFLGPLLIIMIIIVQLKDNKIPQKYKDIWNGNLLTKKDE